LAQRRPNKSRVKSWIGRIWKILWRTVAGCYLFWILALILLKWIDPPTTGVHVQRRVESWFGKRPYVKQYRPVSIERISPDLRHAAVAAEDVNFQNHWGIDPSAMYDAARQSTMQRKRLRGASTITQQLIKNLFFTTHANPIRKLVEWTLAPPAEWILGKQRILELYLNIIEWGPGVYGAEAAARHHYHVPAASLSREQSTRLAACIPAPRRRHPDSMDEYAAIIDARMRRMGH
jgi:monofunctional biosynthetic peptidoglycan transglycosylase